MPNTHLRFIRAIVAGLAGGLVLLGVLGGDITVSAQTPANVAEDGFSTPVKLPSSSGLGEPTIVSDRHGALYVTAPQGIGTVNTAGGSPLYHSTNHGATWSAPVRSQMCTGLSGGDTDLGIDGAGDIWQTDLWLGNSCLSLSTDGGKSFLAGNPFGSELQPGDDRPWIAYDRISNQLFMTYDGLDALHVTATAPLLTPEAGLQVIQDVPAVPECLLGGSNPCNSPNIRQCVCPPGGIAVDNSKGARSGDVYLSYSRQNGGTSGGGVGVARSAPVSGGNGAGINWSYFSIPHTGSTGSAFDTEWNFDPTKVDNNGNLYIMWGELTKTGVAMKFASSNTGGQTWHGPFLISTTTKTNTFPTMDIVKPGVVDFAWYGAPGASGDPNKVSSSQTWNVYYAQATAANTAKPVLSTPVVAIANMHQGCIQTGGNGTCSDRSLLDFFTLAVDPTGHANVIYTAGNAAKGVNLWFTRR